MYRQLLEDRGKVNDRQIGRERGKKLNNKCRWLTMEKKNVWWTIVINEKDKKKKKREGEKSETWQKRAKVEFIWIKIKKKFFLADDRWHNS